MKNVKVQSGQALFDIALLEYGSISSVFQIAEDNAIDIITDELIPGSELMIDENLIIDKNVVMYFIDNNINIATEIKQDVLQGIGYWQIGVDFVVS